MPHSERRWAMVRFAQPNAAWGILERLKARSLAPWLPDMPLLSSERRYAGRVIHVDHDTVRFPDGSTGTLEMIRHPGAAAIVPFLDDPAAQDPRVLLIHQFRHAADGLLWEVPAGTLAPGEAPELCARRELAEEAGMEAGKLVRLTTIFTTPGFTDEKIWLFLATGLEPAPSGLATRCPASVLWRRSS